MNNTKTAYPPSVTRTILRLLFAFMWLQVLVVASQNGFFLYVFPGSMLLATLTVMVYRRVKARTAAIKMRQEKCLSEYVVGENYLSIFSPE